MECQELVVTPSSKKTNLSNLQYRREGCTAVWVWGLAGWAEFSPPRKTQLTAAGLLWPGACNALRFHLHWLQFAPPAL